MCMLMGHMPFFKKYNCTDPFYKLISPVKFHNFWSQMAKSMLKFDKQFVFSAGFKNLIENIFLKKVAAFEDILKLAWIKDETYS